MTNITEMFGNCRVLEKLQEGPLSNVYHAVQEPLGRHVAVKALRPMISPSSPFASQLSREAGLLATLHHENILELYDFVQTETTLWLVVEYVDGVTLADLIARVQRLTPDASAAIATELARALAHSHRRGIIHRDVKPANVLISRRGEVKLVDFGVAQDERVPSSPEPLETGGTFGSPAYMSPEQILGEGVDARTDIFSLGVTLYEMLAGVRPFDGGDLKTTAQRIRQDPPAALRAHAPELPRELEAIVHRCLQKAPGDRYLEAPELRSLLEQVLLTRTNRARDDLIVAELVRAKVIEPRAFVGTPSQIAFASAALPISLWRTVRGFLALLALAIAGGATIQRYSKSADEQAGHTKSTVLELLPTQPGYLRVVARPWAHVIVDGQQVETTPFARPIPLPRGTHYVTLRHPQAAEERRVLHVGGGETVMLDVTMQLGSESRRTASPASGDSGM